MSTNRRERILAELSSGPGAGSSARLCEVSRDSLGVTGAGVMLMSGDVTAGSVCSSDDVSALIEDLQYMLGEGPCIDAYHHDQVVLEPDLANPQVPRWPAFSAEAVNAGACSVFGFPMRVGAVRLGALNFYRDQVGSLSAEQHADAMVMAEVAAQWVLDAQASTEEGALSGALTAGADFHFIVQNAAGVLSARLGVSVTEALIRLRSYAFSHDRPLNDVARGVVDGALSID